MTPISSTSSPRAISDDRDARKRQRDGFRQATITSLRKRAGERCSNPECPVSTSGPGLEDDKAITLGVAAHIRAAAPGGPRYDATMTSAERKHIRNGIWLCQNCAKLIDSDAQRYTVALLEEWKAHIEQLALKAITGLATVSSQSASDREVMASSVHEVIELGDNNDFAGSDDDLKDLATRCASHCIDSKEVTFSVRLRPTVLNNPPTDPLWLPHYEARRRKNGAHLAQCLTALCTPEAYHAWKCYLSTVDAWQAAITTLINGASTRGTWSPGQKLVNVWRTTNPQLSASIDIPTDDYDALLQRLKIEDTRWFRMEPVNYVASDMPHHIIVKYLLPRLVNELIDRQVPVDRNVLYLMTWYIGEG